MLIYVRGVYYVVNNAKKCSKGLVIYGIPLKYLWQYYDNLSLCTILNYCYQCRWVYKFFYLYHQSTACQKSQIPYNPPCICDPFLTQVEQIDPYLFLGTVESKTKLSRTAPLRLPSDVTGKPELNRSSFFPTLRWISGYVVPLDVHCKTVNEIVSVRWSLRSFCKNNCLIRGSYNEEALGACNWDMWGKRT